MCRRAARDPAPRRAAYRSTAAPAPAQLLDTACARSARPGYDLGGRRGARAINISYDQLSLSSAVIDAAQYAKNKGGARRGGGRQPGAEENFTPITAMVPVSATDSSGLITSWSSWGMGLAERNDLLELLDDRTQFDRLGVPRFS